MASWDEEEKRERAAKLLASIWKELHRLKAQATALIVRRGRGTSN